MAAVLTAVRRLGKGGGLRHSFRGAEREGGVAKVASAAVNGEKTPLIFYRPAGQRVSPSMTLPPRT